MTGKRLFQITLFLFTLLFASCNNLAINDSLEQASAVNTSSNRPGYITLSGKVEPTGASPADFAQAGLTGTKVENFSRTAFPDVSAIGDIEYKIVAKIGTKTFEGSISPDDNTSYIVSIPSAFISEQNDPLSITVEVSIVRSDTPDSPIYTGKSTAFTISSTEQVVTVPDITLKAVDSDENGSVKLLIDVTDCGITKCKVNLDGSPVKDSSNNTKEFTPDTNNIITFEVDSLSAKAYKADFYFYDDNKNIFSFSEILNVVCNMETNTWVDSGGENRIGTKTISGKTVRPYCITKAMIDGFGLKEIYVDATNGNDTNSGSFQSPKKNFSAAVQLLTNKDVDYTIFINGTQEGSQNLPINLTNDGSGSLNARTLTIRGVNGNETDILDGKQQGSTLKVNTEVPVIIRDLKITGGGGTGVQGGGINMYTNSFVELSEGAIVTGNRTTSTGGGVYNNGGTLCMNGDAVIGKKGNTIAAYNPTNPDASDCGNIVTGTSGAGAGICIANGGKVLLGYKYSTDPANHYEESKLDGGVFRNYCANTSASSAFGGGIYVSKGSVIMRGNNSYVAYNYALKGAGIALGSTSDSTGSLTIYGGVIEGNQGSGESNSEGAGIYCNYGSITMESGSKILKNTNVGHGGGIFLSTHGSLTMNGGTFKQNSVSDDSTAKGGAIYMNAVSSSKPVFNIKGDAYIPSTAKGSNDVWVDDPASITLTGDLTRDYVASITGSSSGAMKKNYQILTANDYVAANCSRFKGIAPDTSDKNNWLVKSQGTFISIIGTKEKYTGLRDLVFTDGSAIPYTDALVLTDYQKSKAIAYIYAKRNNIFRGIGLQETYSNLCYDGVIGAKTLIGASDQNNGSLNTEKFNSQIDYSPSKYPAIYWVYNYSSSATNLAGSDYSSDWYIPSYNELDDMCTTSTMFNTINSALEKMGGTQLTKGQSNHRYQCSTEADATNCKYNDMNGSKEKGLKNSKYYFRAIRQFN